MKNKKKIILLLALLAVICGLLLWKFWPRPLSRVVGLEGKQIVRIQATAWEVGSEPISEEGFEIRPTIKSFTLDTQEAPEFLPQMEALLQEYQVRPHWRNLLPGEVSGMESQGGEEYMHLLVTTHSDEVFGYISFMGCRFIENGRQYRVTDAASIEQLRQLILTNGQQAE